MDNNIVKKMLKLGLMQLLMKLLKLYILNKEDSNSYVMEQSSKKEMHLYILVLLAYGIPILMVQLLSNMKMTKCIVSFAYLVLLHKYYISLFFNLDILFFI